MRTLTKLAIANPLPSGTWTPAYDPTVARNAVLWTCPRCARIGILPPNSVSPDGVVPGFQCGDPTCGFNEPVQLTDWVA